MDILLSVVVPSFNSEKFLGETLLSIEANQHPNVEYIFVDGGSKDRTMEILKPYRHLFSTVISEPDQGQSDAFNKGFKLASGSYFTWLNSDDVFCAGAVGRLVDYIVDGQSQWYAANMLYIDSESKITRCCRSGPFEAWALKFGILNVFGPSSIFHRDLFHRFGDFRLDFHYCMDTEYWWRMATAGVVYERIPIYLWALRLHEGAKTASAVVGAFGEIPAGMSIDGELLRKTYYPYGKMRRRFGRLLVRAYRVLNGSYIASILDTRRKAGSRI